MYDLKLSELKRNELDRNFKDVQFKYDGGLFYFDGTNLFSAREINRNARFPHIVKALRDSKIGQTLGEIFVEGGSILDLNSSANWNKAKMCLFNANIPIPNPALTSPLKFNSVSEGLKFLEGLESEPKPMLSHAEGLVLDQRYKFKLMKEAKVEITGFEAGSVKGAFILANGSRISALSQGFVQQYQKIKDKRVMCEFEYLFMTKDGNYFQPRLRRIYNEE